jgi:hypothetical protein
MYGKTTALTCSWISGVSTPTTAVAGHKEDVAVLILPFYITAPTLEKASLGSNPI